MEQTRNIIGTEMGTKVQRTYNSGFDYDFKSINLKKMTPVAKTNMIGKVRIICFFTIVALLGFLFIYNFIAMNGIRANINALESSIQNEQTAIEQLKSQINSLSNESAIMQRATEAGYSADIAVNDDILIVKVPKVEVMQSQPQTNWFNDFCEFVSSIFGG